MFRDQSHIDCVRDALWSESKGGASLMVGAGFTRNADTSRTDLPEVPTWREISQEIFNKLYPQHNDKFSSVSVGQTFESGGVLRLAQEFEAAFGRDKLHSLLKDEVCDDYLVPGLTHKRIIRLPWRDVFTTNWDTLLERTRLSVVERVYSIVRNMDEIPQAARPRIVKLHGSLSGHFPLIITEEDYRTYPVTFAPFVNTVQQSMMESVFFVNRFLGRRP